MKQDTKIPNLVKTNLMWDGLIVIKDYKALKAYFWGVFRT